MMLTRPLVFGALGFLVFFATCDAMQPPEFLSITCNPDKTVTIKVRRAFKMYIRLITDSGCQSIKPVTANTAEITMKCEVELDEPFSATILSVLETSDDTDPTVTMVCSVQDGEAHVYPVQLVVPAPTRGSGPLLTGVYVPSITAVIVKKGGTPVTQASVGDELCLVITAEDTRFSMQVRKIEVRSAGKRLILTGENDPGCQSYYRWGVVEKVASNILQVCYTAFELVKTPPSEELIFKAEVLICYSTDFSDCYKSGCLHPDAKRKKRAIERRDVGQATEEVEVTTTLLLNSGDSDGTSDTNTGGSADGQTNVGGNAEEQISTEQCEVCMKKSVLYGLIGFFVPALLLAFGTSVALWLRTRRQKIVEETEIVTSRPPSSVTSSFRNHSFRE